MQLLPKEFSELLTESQLTGTLVNFFLGLVSKNNVDPTKKDNILPVNWLETRATNIRVRALENPV